MSGKIYIIGVGPGDPELLTIKAQKIIAQADTIVYAGSLIPDEILGHAKKMARLQNSAELALDEICDIMTSDAIKGRLVARLHSGDPAIYGAILEQMAKIEDAGVDYELIPGVSSFLAANAALKSELTIPNHTQTIILTRLSGRTPVPEKENLERLASHNATMVIFLSSHKAVEVQSELLKQYPAETATAVVYKVSRPDEIVIKCTLADFPVRMEQKGIKSTALIIVEPGLDNAGKSLLYDKGFTHGFRLGKVNN